MPRTLFCPACYTETNREGAPFVSEWAVATHVAGSIRVRDRLHRSWARQHVPSADLGERSVPRLAEELQWAIRQGISAGRTNTTELEETPIALLHHAERFFHGYVRRALEAHFGTEDDAWWVDGVPLAIRQDCAQRREADPARDELYAYTYFIQLKEIIAKQWILFEENHRRILTHAPTFQKKEFLDYLFEANNVRNRHSHPMRAPEPGSEQYESDLQLARTLIAIARILNGG